MAPVFKSIRQWFHRERQYGHEIKRHHIRMRLQVELESEVGRQRVLAEHASDQFNIKILDAAQARLTRMMDQQYMAKLGLEWERTQLYPAIGARARRGTRLAHLSEKFEPGLARLTWASVDHCLHQILHGDPEDLQRWVADPVALQSNARDLPIVMFDQTPVRLKLWQDGKQLATSQEVEWAAHHKKAARNLKAKPDQRDQLQAQLLRQAQEHPDSTQASPGSTQIAPDSTR